MRNRKDPLNLRLVPAGKDIRLPKAEALGKEIVLRSWNCPNRQSFLQINIIYCYVDENLLILINKSNFFLNFKKSMFDVYSKWVNKKQTKC